MQVLAAYHFSDLLITFYIYWQFLERRCRIDPASETPACEIDDGVHPLREPQYYLSIFSSIAGQDPS